MWVSYACSYISLKSYILLNFVLLNEIVIQVKNVRIFKIVGVVIEISHTSTNSTIQQLAPLLIGYVILKIIKFFINKYDVHY